MLCIWTGQVVADDLPISQRDLVEIVDSPRAKKLQPSAASRVTANLPPRPQRDSRKSPQPSSATAAEYGIARNPTALDTESMPSIQIGTSHASASLLDILAEPKGGNSPVSAQPTAKKSQNQKSTSLEEVLTDSPEVISKTSPRTAKLQEVIAHRRVAVRTGSFPPGDRSDEVVPPPPKRTQQNNVRITGKSSVSGSGAGAGAGAGAEMDSSRTTSETFGNANSSARSRKGALPNAKGHVISLEGRKPSLSPKREKYRIRLTSAERPENDFAIKPIGQILVSSTPPGGTLPENVAARNRAGEPVVWQSDDRGFAQSPFYWEATQYEHQPLYFEQTNLERHGYDRGCLQPFFSAGNFYGAVAMLPYKVVCYPWYNSYSTLGHYRPGSCAPYRCYSLPLRLDATLAEVGAWTGFAFLLP